MKKLLALTALLALSSNAFAMGQQTEAVLQLTGSVQEQLAIDISNAVGDFSGTCVSEHECASDLGELTQPLIKNVAEIGVLSNKAYQIKVSSDNGSLTGQSPTNSLDSLSYDLRFGSEPALTVSQAPAAMIAFPVSGFECSLISGCPGSPAPRHSIELSHVGKSDLRSGSYADTVRFVIEAAE